MITFNKQITFDCTYGLVLIDSIFFKKWVWLLLLFLLYWVEQFSLIYTACTIYIIIIMVTPKSYFILRNNHVLLLQFILLSALKSCFFLLNRNRITRPCTISSPMRLYNISLNKTMCLH